MLNHRYTDERDDYQVGSHYPSWTYDIIRTCECGWTTDRRPEGKTIDSLYTRHLMEVSWKVAGIIWGNKDA